MQNFLIFLIGLYPFFFIIVFVLALSGILTCILGKILTCSCIVLHVSCVCAYEVFDKMPKWNFNVVLDSNEYQTLGITMIIHVYHILIIDCVFYTL